MSACGASLEAQPAQDTISVSRLRIHASGLRETTKIALLCHASAPSFRAWVDGASTTHWKAYPKQLRKRVIHEVTRRTTKRDGFAAAVGAAARQPDAGRLGEQECWEEVPPGSAGVPPACYPVACRSVSLRCGTRPPCRREHHGPSRSPVLAPLSVDPGGGDGRGCGKTCVKPVKGRIVFQGGISGRI